MEIFSLINFYNIFLLIPIYMLCFFSIQRLNAKIKKKRHEAKFVFGKIEKEKRLKNLLQNWGGLEFLRRVDQRLYKQGYPLGLNGYNYYPVKAILLLIFFFLGLKNYNSFAAACLLGIVGFFSVNVYIYANRLIRDNSINNDLLNAADCLYLQLSAGMSLRDALRGLNEICENKDLRMALVRLSTEYDFSEHNIERAADLFKESFSLTEIDLFSSALKQQVTAGNAADTLSNLSEILKESYLDRLNLKTKIKGLYIIMGVIIIMIDILALTMFPIFVDVGEGMRRIFE